jgi:anionic cell wall polymer biosynthesis LytR-Cps2A-Psr (LCP) family protein
MKENLEHTLNFYKGQVELFTELGDLERASRNQEVVNEILNKLNK